MIRRRRATRGKREKGRTMEEKIRYKKSDFDYELPEGLIAQTPAEPRDSSRLLVYDKENKTTEDKIFRDIDIKAMESLEGYFEEPFELPEALVCANDDIANKIWSALKAKGIRIPGDLAISGFDNYDTGTEDTNILTSVDYNIAELGKLAARQVIYRIQNPEASFVLVRLAANVLFRRSTERTEMKSYK